MAKATDTGTVAAGTVSGSVPADTAATPAATPAPSTGSVRAILNPRLGTSWRHEHGKHKFNPGEVVELDRATFDEVSQHRSISWGTEHQTVIEEGTSPRGKELEDAGTITSSLV